MRRHPWRWGVGAAAIYVATALSLSAAGWQVIPLFDGVAPPQPYRWVNPPPEFAEENQPPQPGQQILGLDGEAPAPSAATPDAQAFVSGPAGAFAPEEGQEAVVLSLRPLDPQALGPPPEGLVFDGNAYEVEAVYHPSGDPVSLLQPVTVILRYPIHATEILRWDGQRWDPLPGTVRVPGSLSVYAATSELGTFVSASTPPSLMERILRWLGYLAAAGAAVAAVFLGTARWRRGRRAPARGRHRRPSPRARRRAGKRRAR